MKKINQGFSLIELIVSLVISSIILAAIYQVNLNIQTVVSKNLDEVKKEQTIINNFENLYQFLNNAGAYIEDGKSLSSEKLGSSLTDDEINIQYEGGKSCISRPYNEEDKNGQTRTLSNLGNDIVCTDDNNQDTLIKNAKIESVHYALISTSATWIPSITTSSQANEVIGVYIRYQYLEGDDTNETFGLFSKFNSPK